MKRPIRVLPAALLLALSLVAALAGPGAATTTGRHPGGGTPATKQPVATGTGGAIATVDLDASAAGLEVLRRGGNAVDAAVAAAATLGATEPYSAGIGGGGFLVAYLAGRRRVVTIDGRETAPAAFREDSLIDPATGEPIPFAERVTSGLGVGVPGTLATWRRALRDHGTMPLAKVLAPAIRVAEHGFVVDQTFHDQTVTNAARFAAFPATAELFLPGGAPPPVGSVLRNPDLAAPTGCWPGAVRPRSTGAASPPPSPTPSSTRRSTRRPP
jgi:gamma-glutamyltranspeptidase/glutathione hydrolase